MPDIDPRLLKLLARWDTPTICNGLEVIDPTLTDKGFTARTMFCASPRLTPIVGFARTAKICSREPTSLCDDDQREINARYYSHMAEPPGPTIAIIEDIDTPPGFGAWWGEVHTNIHRALGGLGAVTNGSIRDLDVNAKDFQLLAGGISPSHAHVHVVDVACYVEIFLMKVTPGDIIHADRHGAVVIPPTALPHLSNVITQLTAKEETVLNATREEDFDIQRLLDVMALQSRSH